MRPADEARAVADAVLYEGYVLYPYRASSPKNAVRWQWGVLMADAVIALDPSERSAHRTDVVVDGRATSVHARVRFLRVQRRQVQDESGHPVERLETADTTYVPWDEAREEEIELELPLTDGLDRTVELDGGTETEELPEGRGRLVRSWDPVRIGVTTQTRCPESPYPVTVLTVRVENRTSREDPGPDRPAWLRSALVACHVLLELDEGSFVSLLDPPHWASQLVAECENDGVFPVLAGPAEQAQIVLSSPIILYDHPALAAESESTFFDGLEIDELLSLRTMTLSEEEKREARGTDPRVAALLGEVDAMPPELWDRLHGAVRQLDVLAPPPAPEQHDPDVPWWDPGSDTSVDPETDAVEIHGVEVRKGARLILRPGIRRADAYDLFLAGREATVEAVLQDVDGHVHLAVSVDDDPGQELKAAHGRYLYFAPDEVEPLAPAPRP